ncbi:MAG: LuxR C-terminal-related transcriptional regulator [Xenococcus sp. (in: cyanobacteria)]
MLKTQVLLIETDPAIALGLPELINQQDRVAIIVDVATNYQDGLLKAISSQPDLILMDLNDGKGLKLAEQIRENLPKIKILFLSANLSKQEDLISLIADGYNGFCLKGISIDKLIEAIQVTQEEDSIYLDSKIVGDLRKQVSRLKHITRESSKEINQIMAEFTERQKDVLKLLVQGKDNTEIGQSLHINPYTVRSHITAIRNKLVVKNKSEAIAKCWSSGLAYEL